MGDYFERQADVENSGRKYAQSGASASDKISEASSLPCEGIQEGGGSELRGRRIAAHRE
jgi:hypothetical protein